jgi:hypothetical protein
MWTPLFAALALSVVAVEISVVQAMVDGVRTTAPTFRRRPRAERVTVMAVTAALHLIQPLARLSGRIRHGLTPWRVRGPAPARHLVVRRTWTLWSERWRTAEAWLEMFERRIGAMDIVVVRGGDFDAWDLDARGGLLAGVRVVTAVEEHGDGHQLLRFRVRPWPTTVAWLLLSVLLGAAGAAALAAAWGAAVSLGLLGGLVAARAVRDSAVATAAVRSATLDEVGGAGARDPSAPGEPARSEERRPGPRPRRTRAESRPRRRRRTRAGR